MSLVESIERQIAEFMADPAQRRLGLPCMPKPERAIVHELSQDGYGLASVSVG